MMPQLKFSFTKEERLLKRVEFLTVTDNGKKVHTRNFIIFTRPNALEFSRIGITVSRKVGNAVKRNRVKRVVREFFRLNKAGIEKGIDIVVIAKQGAVSIGFAEVSKELGNALITASRLKSSNLEERRRG